MLVIPPVCCQGRRKSTWPPPAERGDVRNWAGMYQIRTPVNDQMTGLGVACTLRGIGSSIAQGIWMCAPRFLLPLLLFEFAAMTAQTRDVQAEPEIDKNTISVHPVRQGDMPIRLTPVGEVVSLSPPEVVPTVPTGTQPSPQEGQ